MKKIVCCLALIFMAQLALAQTDFADVNTPTEAEFDLKECVFDMDADAVVLFDKGYAYYDEDYKLITERRVRIKILKEKGIARGDIALPYYSDGDYESIYDLSAYVWNVDEKKKATMKTVDKKSMFRKKVGPLHSIVTFAMPEIKVGSILEYKYRSRIRDYGGLTEWEFQNSIPVVVSSFNLVILPNHEFNYTVNKSRSMPIVIKPDSQNGSIYYEMKNIPGLRDEAYMDAANDYLQKVNFQFAGFTTNTSNGYTTTRDRTQVSATWKDISKELMLDNDYGGQLTKDLAGTEALSALCSKVSDEIGKMKIVHQYVRDNLSWNYISSWQATESIKNVWQKKTGTSTEINLILINFLKSLGFEVYPMLVSERDHGKVDTTILLKRQFNKTVAYVKAAGRFYILDASEKSTPSQIIPSKLLNTYGFLVDIKKYQFLPISDQQKKYANQLNLIGAISSDGIVEGQAVLKCYDYSRIAHIDIYKKDQKQYQQELFQKPYTNAMRIDSVILKDVENDSLPLQHNIFFKNALTQTDGYYFLNYNLFSGLDKNPFVNDFRFTNINFGTGHAWSFAESFKFPSNLAVEGIPQNIKVVSEDRSMVMTRELEKRDETINVFIKIEIQRTVFPATEYSVVKNFYKKMIELLNEPVVFKKKS